MFVILAPNGKEYGPVAAAKVRDWIVARRTTRETLARRANESGWRPLSLFSDFAAAFNAASHQPSAPAPRPAATSASIPRPHHRPLHRPLAKTSPVPPFPERSDPLPILKTSATSAAKSTTAKPAAKQTPAAAVPQSAPAPASVPASAPAQRSAQPAAQRSAPNSMAKFIASLAAKSTQQQAQSNGRNTARQDVASHSSHNNTGETPVPQRTQTNARPALQQARQQQQQEQQQPQPQQSHHHHQPHQQQTYSHPRQHQPQPLPLPQSQPHQPLPLPPQPQQSQPQPQQRQQRQQQPTQQPQSPQPQSRQPQQRQQQPAPLPPLPPPPPQPPSQQHQQPPPQSHQPPPSQPHQQPPLPQPPPTQVYFTPVPPPHFVSVPQHHAPPVYFHGPVHSPVAPAYLTPAQPHLHSHQHPQLSPTYFPPQLVFQPQLQHQSLPQLQPQLPHQSQPLPPPPQQFSSQKSAIANSASHAAFPQYDRRPDPVPELHQSSRKASVKNKRRMRGDGGIGDNTQKFSAHSRHLHAGSCLRHSWELFTMNSGAMASAALVLTLLMSLTPALASAGNVLQRFSETPDSPHLLQRVAGVLGKPALAFLQETTTGSTSAVAEFAGTPSLLTLLLGVFTGGILLFFVERCRFFNSPLSTIFIGFKRTTLDLLLLVLTRRFAFGLLAVAPLCVLFVTTQAALGRIRQSWEGVDKFLPAPIREMFGSNESALTFSGTELALLCVVAIGALAALFYLFVSWRFATYLVIDRRLRFWKALEISRRVVASQWRAVLWLQVLSGLLLLGGALCLGVGFLIALPVVLVANTCAYEDLFGGEDSASVST